MTEITYDENNIFDEGTESTPSVNDAPAASEPPQVDSPADTPADEPSAEPGAGKEADKEEVSKDDADENGDASDEEFEKFEKEVEQSLADEKTPKWFRNAVSQYKSRLTSVSEKPNEFEPLSEHGTVEEIAGKLELVKGLDAIQTNAETNLPEPTTKPFVDRIYKEKPETAFQLLRDLTSLPSLKRDGYALIHDILETTGIDPTRLNDIKRFAENGYQIAPTSELEDWEQEELENIPKELHEAYKSLSKAERVDLLAAPDTVREKALQSQKRDIEDKAAAARAETEKAQQQQQEKVEAERKFYQELESDSIQIIQESGSRIYDTFVDSLVNQANFSSLDANMVANTVINALNNPDRVEGRKTLEALKAEGIELDAKLPEMLKEWEEAGSRIAYFSKIKDADSKAKAVSRQLELERQISLKGNKIVAALAEKRAKAVTEPMKKQNDLLTKAQTQNGFQADTSAAQIGTGKTSYNGGFSPADYEKDGIFA